MESHALNASVFLKLFPNSTILNLKFQKKKTSAESQAIEKWSMLESVQSTKSESEKISDA